MARCYATLILLQCLLFLASSPTFALNLPYPNTLPQYIDSSGESAIDPRFMTLFNDGAEDLSDKSVYLTVLKALRDWSRHDLSHPASVGRYQYANFKDVEINIERDDTSTQELTWQFAIWGLYQAVRRVQYSGFLNCRTMLLWEGQKLGYIYIQKFDPASADASEPPPSSNPPIPTRATSNLTASFTNTTTLQTSPKINLAINPIGRRLSKWAVFYPIYSAMVALTPDDQSAPIPTQFKTFDRESKTVLSIEPWSEPRSAPPYFMPSTTITALALIPVWMYEKKRFNEVTLVFQVDEVPVGYGYIRQQRLVGLEGGGNGTGGFGAGDDSLITDP